MINELQLRILTTTCCRKNVCSGFSLCIFVSSVRFFHVFLRARIIRTLLARPLGVRQVKLQLYRTAILPHLTYCSVVWHFIKASDTCKLESIQERALRTIYRDKVSSYEELLATAGLPTLFNRRLRDIFDFSNV